MKRTRYTLAAVVMTALTLAACSPDAASPGPATNTPTEKPLKVLVHGPVESEYYEPLRNLSDEDIYDGSQGVEDYDVVIFDGEAHTPEDVAGDALIRSAFRTGKIVLGVDMTEAHKKDGLHSLVNASSCGDSQAYAVSMTQDSNSRPVMQVFESHPGKGTFHEDIPAREPSDSQICDTPEGVAQSQTDIATDAAAFAGALRKRISKGTLEALQAGPANIPDDLLYVTYQFSKSSPWGIAATGEAPIAVQNFSQQENYTFTVFLNNKNNPQGDFQYVLVDADMTTNPTAGQGNFVANAWKSKNNWQAYGYSEWAWFTNAATMTVWPTDNSWTTVATSPETVNGVSSVTTGASFSIGFSGTDPSASYTYSNTVTRNLSEWQVTNESSGLETWWDYRTQAPFNADQNYADCGQAWQISNGCYGLLGPNALSTGNMQLHTQSVFRTASVVDGNATINTQGYQQFADVFCMVEGGINCYQPEAHYADQRIGTDYTINLGAVIPIPIASITFDPNPAKSGTAVTGTITLSKPAAMDTSISLASSNENASILPTVVVKQGQTSANFRILTDANGIPSGGQSVATITAFYADDFQAQLTITN